MKTVKPPAAAPEAPPGRRSQPVRQTRTNPPRTSSTSSRTFGRDAAGGAAGTNAGHEQPIDIFPGVTHFADAITALPKELVKHFTLLKEVDAKIHVPEQALFQLIDTALRVPPPNTTRSPYDGRPYDGTVATAPASAPTSAQNSDAGTPMTVNGTPLTIDGFSSTPSLAPNQLATTTTPTAADDAMGESAFDPINLPRRQLFRQVAIEIKEMLVALEEKNHVISTANDALNKQLARIDGIWPHLELEFSDEAKFGSTTHWAYPEFRHFNRTNNNAQAERSRREGAASLSAAAQQIADEAAARSDARKQAVAARRHQKSHGHGHGHQDSDADDHHPAKKSGSSRSRKPLPDVSGVGLGISGAAGPAGANGNGTTSSTKRRKTDKADKNDKNDKADKNDKPAASSAPMERALSGVMGSAAANAKARTASPRGSPAPDGSKKRKAPPAGGNQAKKSRNGTSAASSPVIGSFPDTKPIRGSPAPTSSLANQFPDIGSKPNHTGSALGGNNGKTGSAAPAEGANGAARDGGGSSAASENAAGRANTDADNSGSASNTGAYDNSNHPGSRGSSTAGNSNSTALTTPNAGVEDKKNDDGKDSTTSSVTLSAAPAVAAAVSTIAQGPDAEKPEKPGGENDKKRPTALALPADTHQSGASPTATTPAEATPHANGARTPADKAAKDASTPSTASALTAAAPSAAKSEGLKMKVEMSDLPASATSVPSSAGGGGSSSGNNNNNNGAASGTTTTITTTTTTKKEAAATSAAKAADEVVTKKEPTPSRSASRSGTPSQHGTVTTKSGRASKPSTPLLGTFTEASRPSRPSRTTEAGGVSSGNSSSSGSGNGNGNGNGVSSSSSSSTTGGSGSGVVVKRSHKKGASISSQAHAQAAIMALAAGGGGGGSGHGPDAATTSAGSHGHSHSHSGSHSGSGSKQHQSQSQHQSQHQHHQSRQHSPDEDEEDPLYCYCNRVSFGEMIACDAKDCAREWFHLECVGLRVAPKPNVKWYCDDCKKRLRVGERKTNGR